MDRYGFFELTEGQPHEGNRLLIECAAHAAGGSVELGQSFVLRGDQLKEFFGAVRERCSRPPLSDSEFGPWLDEHIGWWEEDNLDAMTFHTRVDGSGIISPYDDDQVPTIFPESATRGPDANWLPADLPAPGTRLP